MDLDYGLFAEDSHEITLFQPNNYGMLVGAPGNYFGPTIPGQYQPHALPLP